MRHSLTIACVMTGNKYSVDDVYRLHRMVSRYLKFDRFVCLNDTDLCYNPNKGVEFLNLGFLDLPGWWMKMALFRSDWRRHQRVIYFDLDTLIMGDLEPLASIDVLFAICANFTRRNGNTLWPCKYGSCQMIIGADMSNHVWRDFDAHRKMFMNPQSERFGDQLAIEQLVAYPPVILQDALPDQYLIGYRDLTDSVPEKTAIVNFGGSHKAHNSPHDWVRAAWKAA